MRYRLARLLPAVLLVAAFTSSRAASADDHAGHSHAAPAAKPAAAADEHAGHSHAAPAASTAAAVARDPKLPAGELQAAAVLENSPRHGEYVGIPLPGSETPMRAWIVYPERKDKAPVVIVIHEIFGVSPWIRALTDQLAAEGYIAVAPDLVSGYGPGGGGTDSTKSRDEVVALVRGLAPDVVKARLDATHDWATALPAAAPRAATIGFCWGGSKSFQYAAEQPKLKAAIVYYGSSPDSATLLKVTAPVLGLYGGDDARVNATIEPAKKALAARKKFYEPNTYDGAGHGFLRQQDGRDGKNLLATQKAWPRTVAFLKKELK